MLAAIQDITATPVEVTPLTRFSIVALRGLSRAALNGMQGFVMGRLTSGRLLVKLPGSATALAVDMSKLVVVAHPTRPSFSALKLPPLKLRADRRHALSGQAASTYAQILSGEHLRFEVNCQEGVALFCATVLASTGIGGTDEQRSFRMVVEPTPTGFKFTHIRKEGDFLQAEGVQSQRPPHTVPTVRPVSIGPGLETSLTHRGTNPRCSLLAQEFEPLQLATMHHALRSLDVPMDAELRDVFFRKLTQEYRAPHLLPRHHASSAPFPGAPAAVYTAAAVLPAQATERSGTSWPISSRMRSTSRSRRRITTTSCRRRHTPAS